MRRRDFLALAGLALAGCATSQPAVPPRGLATDWAADPWSRGAYSALPAGTPYWVREDLSRALIAGRIVLAGEYVAPDYPATVRGAYTSGEHAARRVLAKVPAARRVVVVGAGLAGLRAAQVLRTAGRQVVVLEARDRVGGRVRTDRSLGVPLELGAAWLHGVTGHPLVEVVQEAGLTLTATDYGDMTARSASGGQVPGVRAATAELWRLQDRIGSTRPPRARSVAQALAGRGWRADTAARRLVEHCEIDLEFGLPARELGAQALWEGRAYRGGDQLVQGGFDRVPELMAAGLDVRLSAPVARVEVVGAGVRVAGLTADAAVVAVPLALLQRDLPALPWPSDLRRRLAALTTGALEKAFLRYPQQWWPQRQVLRISGTPGQRWSEWYNLATVVGAPVVFGFCGGSSAVGRPGNDALVLADAREVFARAYR